MTSACRHVGASTAPAVTRSVVFVFVLLEELEHAAKKVGNYDYDKTDRLLLWLAYSFSSESVITHF